MSAGVRSSSSRAASSNASVQSKPLSGAAQSIRRRLWTMLPLPTISTPRRAGVPASRPARSDRRTVLFGIDRELHDRNVCVGEGVHQHRPGAVVDPPAVHVEADPGRRTTSATSSAKSGSPGAGYCTRTARRGTRRSRGSCAVAASRSPRWRGCTSAPRSPGWPGPRHGRAECPPSLGVTVASSAFIGDPCPKNTAGIVVCSQGLLGSMGQAGSPRRRGPRQAKLFTLLEYIRYT